MDDDSDRTETARPKRRAGPQTPKAVDVARLAGVSRTQVSYVLNDKNARHVSAEKRERILEASRTLGYRPRQSAQALRRGWSNEFVLFFPAPYVHRINAMLGAIHETGLADGCVPVQYSFNSYHSPERKSDAFRALLARRPRGIFLSLFDVDPEDLDYAKAQGVERILLYDIEPRDGCATLVLPMEEVGYLSAKHLIERGHRRLGLVRPSDPIPARAYQARLKGMRRAVEERPGASVAELPWPADEYRPTPAGGARFIAEHGLGRGGKAPTGINSFGDDFAFPIMACLRDQGLDVPGDLALVGTDDSAFGALVRPALSSIRLDQESLGLRAVALINSLITGTDVDENKAPPLVPKLIHRQTS